MHEALQTGREAVADDRALISCRNQAGTIERGADLVYEDAQHGLQYAIAKQAEQQAKASHRLNVLAAFFLPIATFAAVFGMNIHHGLEHFGSPWIFWLLLLAGLVLGLIVRSIVSPTDRQLPASHYDARDPSRLDRPVRT